MVSLLQRELLNARRTASNIRNIIVRGEVVSTRVEGSVGADRDAKLAVSWDSVVRSDRVDAFENVGTPISFEEHRLGYQLASVSIIEGGEYAAAP